MKNSNSLNSSFKTPKNFYHKSSKVENIQRTHKDHNEQRISNKLIAKDLSQFCSKDLSIHNPHKVKTICVWIKPILELKIFPRRSNKRIILLSSIQKIHLWNIKIVWFPNWRFSDYSANQLSNKAICNSYINSKHRL